VEVEGRGNLNYFSVCREVRGLGVDDDVVPIGGLEGHLGDFKKYFLVRSRKFI
jgi:hypothetical protein